jgi:hypothetical protein
MKALCYSPLRRSEAGVALLISIFVLMLISLMALSLIVSSGTETALAGNYRSSANVYYAALAGLEEGRGRLLAKNLNPLGPLVPTPLPVNQVLYILNPAPGEAVTPNAAVGSPGYPDTEYGNEFPGGLGGATVTTTSSVSPIAGLPPALYKWVRINAVTEASLNLDVNGDGFKDPNTALYYDSLDANCKPKPILIPTLSVCPPSSTAAQALEVTSLAALPDGSQRLLQYVVAPVSTTSNFPLSNSAPQGFPSALTLVGNGVQFTGPTGPNSAQFQVNGNDQCSATSAVSSIGYTNSGDSSLQNILNGIGSNKNSYPGAGKATPSVVNVTSLPPNLQTPSGLDALVQTITQNADAVLTGPSDETKLPAGMSAGNPVTVVVNGDFDLGSHSTGFGVLVVTGTFSFDTDSSWKGVILVIGQGAVVSNNIGNTNGEIDGAMLIAQTRDASGKLLPDPNLGSASFVVNGTQGGLGIYYSSCWIKAAQAPFTYKILSYHQISQ